MKRILAIVLIPYLVFIGAIFYFYFGPGIATGYEPLQWKDLDIQVPKNFKIKPYESKGWDVYSLKKLTVLIKIARKPAFDVTGLPQYGGKILYKYSPGPDLIFYISNPRKTYEVVFARTVDDISLYFGVSSPSVFSATYILEKMLAHGSYRGKPLAMPHTSLPFMAYLTDWIFLAGITLPFLIMIVIFGFSGGKPSERYFSGDSIACEEGHVYFTRVRRFRRNGNFCYLVLTYTRLMIFVFKRPILEIPLDEEKANITIDGKRIVIRRAEEKIVLRPSDIEKWKDCLQPLGSS